VLVPQVPLAPAPQLLLSQSVFRWHAVPVPAAQVPPVHDPLSHWAAAVHACPLVVQLPATAPVPLPHTLLSQSVFAWQVAPARIAQVPVALPLPLPQAALSQSAFEWQTLLAGVRQVPATPPVPEPHTLLSQSAFL
jgi:hypothetical protein